MIIPFVFKIFTGKYPMGKTLNTGIFFTTYINKINNKKILKVRKSYFLMIII